VSATGKAGHLRRFRFDPHYKLLKINLAPLPLFDSLGEAELLS